MKERPSVMGPERRVGRSSSSVAFPPNLWTLFEWLTQCPYSSWTRRLMSCDTDLAGFLFGSVVR